VELADPLRLAPAPGWISPSVNIAFASAAEPRANLQLVSNVWFGRLRHVSLEIPAVVARRGAWEEPLAEVELRSVSKSWGAEPAVDDVSFIVREGSLSALLGPSGCGKSTTLRLVAGLEAVTSGSILIGSQDVTRLSPAKRKVSMVFQSYALFPHLSVAENIVFGLKVRGVASGERATRLQRAADLLGLEKLLERKPSQLSGGQQQRVALGRAIVAQAPVCLMDEPLSNLDAQLRVEMRREIRALQQRLGITMLYVTHDQLEAMTMADQVLLMRQGQIEQNGSPAELYQNPATIFTARFVGTPPMNLLPGASIGPMWQMLQSAAPPGHSQASLSIGVRAEAAKLGSSGIDAKVTAIEYLGADTLIDARIADLPFVVRVPGRSTLTAGEKISIAWDTDATHWFDATTGRRLK
jgi:sn-glycerol 3-phosphate transport system ATP-binding protein